MHTFTTPRRSAVIAALLCGACALLLNAHTAHAQETTPRHMRRANKLMDDAKKAYNAERYKDAAKLYTQAAQTDPGAHKLKGVPFKNLARCMYWSGSYDRAVYWYDVYIESWPKDPKIDAIRNERDAANERRSNPSKPVPKTAVYDAALLELVRAVRGQLSKSSTPALTAEGGGTLFLVRRALQQGYVMPELHQWSKSLSVKLVRELQFRWAPVFGSPLPDLNKEPIAISTQRLAALGQFASSPGHIDATESYNTLLRAWAAFQNENYNTAAINFMTLQKDLPTLGYLPYAAALSRIKAGEWDKATKILSETTPNAPTALIPYYKLLHAEALREEEKHTAAAALYLEALTNLPTPSQAKKPKTTIPNPR